MATYVIDLTHLLDENGLPPVDAPRALLKALAFYGSIVNAGSAHPAGTRFPSMIRCRRRAAKSRLTITHGGDGTICWECPECGDNGYISKWQGTDYDLGAVVEPDPSRRIGVPIAADEHELLSGIVVASREEAAIIAGGMVTEQEVWISGRDEDFEELLGSIAFDANHTRSAKRRQVMDVIYGKVQRMLAESGSG